MTESSERAEAAQQISRSTSSPNSQSAASTRHDVQRGATAIEGEKGAAEEKDANLVSWDVDADSRNPLAWSTAKRWTILMIVSTCSLCVTCTSSVVSSTFESLESDFRIGHEVAILGLSLFVLGLGIGPLALAPLSEFYGRRPVYLSSFGLFVLLGLPVSFANNPAVFFIFRFLTGVFGSAFLSVAGGTVADLFLPKDMALPMAAYTMSPFLGPILGPLYAGFATYFSTWRWTFWTINIWSFIMWIALLLFVSETFHPAILTTKAKHLRRSTGNPNLCSAHELKLREKSIGGTLRANSTKVIQLLILEPMLALLCLWTALLLGILYLFFEAFPIVFGAHGFNLWQTGLSFLGLAVGLLLGAFTMPYWARRYRRAMAENGGQAPPEARLPMAMVAAILNPISLFWFAFTTYPAVHWSIPIVASIPFGAGILFTYSAVFSYTADVWRPVAASALGANSISRSLFACVFPLFATQMYTRLGNAGATALLAGLNVLMVPIPFIFAKYGPQLRAKSRYSY
ncbi:Synaptic vesicle transporter SVOP and related transporters (major facilitator superfamily) [Ceraceosorus bombacis]|uniref:Synaptic vesicle transporter SVOP and related transporters (Major facilitator superfamily) n=1 Tax=Ceraceosorus bombacis TaxID=401625 RepID=A0A0P1BAZ6_9BASI|nr:Synaptic vesicle transporter SVOP and related transporters (major facilitator superfamily) [Ceraceosorus bombacis]